MPSLAAGRFHCRRAAGAMPPRVLSQRAWAACSAGRRVRGPHAHAEHGSLTCATGAQWAVRGTVQQATWALCKWAAR
jgi:hypothetical protein